MTKREEMYRRIEKHGEDLKRVFGLSGDPVELCKRLHRLESKANLQMCAYCNGELTESEIDAFCARLRKSLEKIIGPKNMSKIYINYDPRGYTLKLKEEVSSTVQIYKDWGGYGIIAPDLSN